MGYYAEREFQKALKYSLLEAEAAKAKQLESNRRRSQEKKENSLNSVNETPSRTNSINGRRSIDVNKTKTSVPSTTNSAIHLETTTSGSCCFDKRQVTSAACESKLENNVDCNDKPTCAIEEERCLDELLIDETSTLIEEKSICSFKSPLNRSQNKSPISVSISLTPRIQSSPFSKSSNNELNCNLSESCSSKSTSCRKLITKRFFKSGLSTLNTSSPCSANGKGLLESKSACCHRPMRRAKANVSLYDFHLEFDDEDSPIKTPFKSHLVTNQSKNGSSKVLSFQSCVSNDIRKKLLHKYSVKPCKKLSNSSSKVSNAHKRTVAVKLFNKRNRKLTSKSSIVGKKSKFTKNKSKKAQMTSGSIGSTGSTGSTGANKSSRKEKQTESIEEVENQEIVRKTQIFIRNLQKLRQHIRERRQRSQQEEKEEQELDSPIRKVFRNMSSDLRSIDCFELDCNYYDPLTVAGLLSNGFEALDLNQLFSCIPSKCLSSNSAFELPAISTSLASLPEPVFANFGFKSSDYFNSLDVDQQNDLKNHLYACLDSIESQHESFLANTCCNNQEEREEEEEYRSAPSSPHTQPV